MARKILIIIGFCVLVVICFLLVSGGTRNDVILKKYDASLENNKLTINVGVSSSAGYVRKMKMKCKTDSCYLIFYSTFGINSRMGANDTFVIDVDDNIENIYFYTNINEYEKVLEKSENGEWVRATFEKIETDIKNVSAEIFNISSKGADIIITDKNVVPNIYGEWYEIEKFENDKWNKLDTIIVDYGFNELGYLVDENGEVKFSINWEWLYGNLENGNYRILKQVGDKYIKIPFNIGDLHRSDISNFISE